MLAEKASKAVTASALAKETLAERAADQSVWKTGKRRGLSATYAPGTAVPQAVDLLLLSGAGVVAQHGQESWTIHRMIDLHCEVPARLLEPRGAQLSEPRLAQVPASGSEQLPAFG